MLSDELAKAEQEIRTLKAQLTEMQNTIGYMMSIDYILDNNKDGVIDATDASFVLNYYALTSTGYKFNSFSEYYNYTYGEPVGQILPR